MKHDSILIKIREQRFYAGQIYRIESEPARSSNLTTATDALQRMVDHGLSNHVKNAMGELLARAGIATLHEHQEKVLERLLNEEDVVLAAPPGSGRGMVVCLGALYRSLHQRQTVLILAPSERSLARRSLFLKRIVADMGVEYACSVAALHEVNIDSPAFPDILLATPVQLMRLLEGSLVAPFNRDFLRALGLVILEDVHEWSGTPGRHVEKLLRCLQIERHTWNGTPWQVCATGLGYANLVEIASRLACKLLDTNSLITSARAGTTAKALVFWNPPLVWNEVGDRYRRKDYVKDVGDLVDFLARQGLSTCPETARRFLVLVDCSASMEGSRWDNLSATLAKDLPDLVEAQDELSVRPFDTSLHQQVVSGKRADLESDRSLKEAIAAGLAAVRDFGGTQIGASLLTAVQEESSLLKPGQTLVVFLYSDGEDDIDSSTAHSVRTKTESLAAAGNVVHLIYVSLGIQPHPTVRAMVESCNGCLVDAGHEAADTVRPTQLWKRSAVDERPVFVLAYDDSLTAGDIRLTDLTDTRRPVEFRSRLGSPQWEKMSGVNASLASAQYVVVVGWDASPALMRHAFQRLGNHDAVIFLIGTPKAGNQALLRQWPGVEEIHDAVSLGPDTPEVAEAMANVVFRDRTLSDSELKSLLGEHAEDEETLTSSSKVLSLSVTDNETSPSTVVERLQIARRPLQVRGLGLGQDNVLMDRLEPFRTLLPKGDIVVNGMRKHVDWSEANGFEIIGGQNHPAFAFAKASATWSPLGQKPTAAPSLFGLAISRRRIRVELILERVDSFFGAAFDEAASPSTTGKQRVSFVTNALILTPESDKGKTKSAFAGMESLLWNYLTPLVKGDPRSLLALADESRAEIAVFQIADGPTDLPGILCRNNHALLGAALRTGFLAMMDCPCHYGSSIGDRSQPAVASDPGCPWCLQSPTKLAGLPPSALEKRSLLDWLGSIPIVDGFPYQERIRHKYELLDDNRRLTGDIAGGSLCSQILAVLEAKLGIQIAEPDRAQVAFSTQAERDQMPGAAGWYGGDIIRVNPYPEFSVLDILAHEYGHNWQATKPLPPISPANLSVRYYNEENVEQEGNLPFFGKLFIEGSAVWIESHAMDFFAYRSQLDSSGVGAEQACNFEYWQGLRVVKYLEEKFGMKSVFRFLETGSVFAATEGEVRDNWHLYELAGLAGFLINQGTEAADQRVVPLFATPGFDLSRHENLIRVSAWLAQRGAGIAWSQLPEPQNDRKGNPPNLDDFVASVKAAGWFGKLTIKTILETSVTKDAGADDVLAAHQLEDHVVHTQSQEIPVSLACHLKSRGGNPTSGMLTPIVGWLAERFREDLEKRP